MPRDTFATAIKRTGFQIAGKAAGIVETERAAMAAQALDEPNEFFAVEEFLASVAFANLQAWGADFFVGGKAPFAGAAHATPTHALGDHACFGHARFTCAVRALHALILPRCRPRREQFAVRLGARVALLRFAQCAQRAGLANVSC